DGQVLAFDVAELAHALTESVEERRSRRLRIPATDPADPRRLSRLASPGAGDRDEPDTETDDKRSAFNHEITSAGDGHPLCGERTAERPRRAKASQRSGPH